MLVEDGERKAVDVDVLVATLEKTPCRPDVFHYKMAYAPDYLYVPRWNHVADGSVAESGGHEIESGPYGGLCWLFWHGVCANDLQR